MKLVLAPKHNTDVNHDGRVDHDASGAFLPEARAFCALHKAAGPILFDNLAPLPARLAEVSLRLAACSAGTVDTLAIFCHGWKAGLQCGVTMATVGDFAGALARVFSPSPRVVLYACDTGRDGDAERSDDDDPGPGGNGGLADKLRDELVRRDVHATIFAHTSTAHSTYNPYVRRFAPDELAGGRWVVEPYSELWEPWRRALRGPLRFRFPFMEQEQIETELRLQG